MSLIVIVVYLSFLWNSPQVVSQTVTTTTISPTTSATDGVICVPFERIQGCQPGENGFEPIICTATKTKENITCYPQQEVLLFLSEGPIGQRVRCSQAVVTITERCMSCVPVSEVNGLKNRQGIVPIQCQMKSNKKIVTCYPGKRVVFPTSEAVSSCTPADVDPFICSPVSPANGPPNFYGIPPINCQKIIDSSVVECYPNRVIPFPAQCPDRILCFPLPPEPIQKDSYY